VLNLNHYPLKIAYKHIDIITIIIYVFYSPSFTQISHIYPYKYFKCISVIIFIYNLYWSFKN